MKKETLDKAVAMAKASIYDNAEYIGRWKGYEVFEPGFDDDEPRFIGMPQFILEKGDVFRWSIGDEWREISHHFYPSNEDDKE